MKGMATLEFIVIVAIVLLMITGALDIWQGSWGLAMEKATSATSAFELAMGRI